MQERGGIARALNLSALTTGLTWGLESLTTKIIVRTATNAVRMYFTAADLAADANFWTVATTDLPLVIEAECRELYFRGVGGTSAVSVLAILRKG